MIEEEVEVAIVRGEGGGIDRVVGIQTTTMMTMMTMIIEVNGAIVGEGRRMVMIMSTRL